MKIKWCREKKEKQAKRAVSRRKAARLKPNESLLASPTLIDVVEKAKTL